MSFGNFLPTQKDEEAKTFVSQHVVWNRSFEPRICNCLPRNKIAEQALGDPRGNCRNGQSPGMGVPPMIVFSHGQDARAWGLAISWDRGRPARPLYCLPMGYKNSLHSIDFMQQYVQQCVI
jgi:hypothetical protein